MPYLSPSLTTTSIDEHRVTKAGGHRRSRSLNQTFSAERGPGAFSPLMGLPRRAARHSGAKKSPIFQLADSDDETSHPPDPDSKDSDTSGGLLGLSGLDVPKEPTAVPFPCLSPEVIDSQHSPFVFPPPADLVSQPWTSSEPSERAPDSPIIRKSNGQPLKPSLKVRKSSQLPCFLPILTNNGILNCSHPSPVAIYHRLHPLQRRVPLPALHHQLLPPKPFISQKRMASLYSRNRSARWLLAWGVLPKAMKPRPKTRLIATLGPHPTLSLPCQIRRLLPSHDYRSLARLPRSLRSLSRPSSNRIPLIKWFWPRVMCTWKLWSSPPPARLCYEGRLS